VKTLTAILTILILLTACKRATVDLRGHWHVWEYEEHVELARWSNLSIYNKDESFHRDSCEMFFVDYETLDVLSNTTSVWNKGLLGYNGIGGYYDLDEQTISIRGECLHLYFEFEFKNDTLFMAEKSGKRYIALKGGCCDKQKEFFGEDMRVDIDLPISTNRSELIHLNEVKLHLCPDAYLGGSQGRYMNCFGPYHRLLLSQKFMTKHDIRHWLETNKETVVPSQRESITPIVFSTETTDYVQFFELLDSIYQVGRNKVYLAFREENFQDSLSVWLKPIDLEKDDYKSFIKKNYRDYYEVTGAIPLETNN
jgi:hypothetical protein